jgi:K+-sensing histidine kinase KdpD
MAMFTKILVVVDEAGETRATSYAQELSSMFDASVQMHRAVAPHGVTSSRRSRQVAEAIAEAARLAEADLIVLGVDRRRAGRHHLTGSVREQLAQLTHLPVMVPPLEPVRTGSRQLMLVHV